MTRETPIVGWYIHHHGAGHLTRFLAVRRHLRARVVVFSSLPAPEFLPPETEWVLLSRDDEVETDGSGVEHAPADASPDAGGLLHWAPIGHRGHATRLARIATAISTTAFSAFVVDVSAEVTLLVRLLGVEVVLMTQPGDRDDTPHRLAFDAATAIIAPWAEGNTDAPALVRVATKVSHVGAISRFGGRSRTRAAEPNTVLFLAGGGSAAPVSAAQLAEAARAVPTVTWRALGISASTPDSGPIETLPWTNDPWTAMCEAEIIISLAGQNSIADLAALGASAIVIPQDRPFGEQRATAESLARDGLAVVLDEWPSADRWAGILDDARALRPDWTLRRVDGGAQRAARVIDEVMAR